MTNPTNEDERVEQAARAIFEHWRFGSWYPGDKAEWVPGGNSMAQGLARDFARAALSSRESSHG